MFSCPKLKQAILTSIAVSIRNFFWFILEKTSAHKIPTYLRNSQQFGFDFIENCITYLNCSAFSFLQHTPHSSHCVINCAHVLIKYDRAVSFITLLFTTSLQILDKCNLNLLQITYMFHSAATFYDKSSPFPHQVHSFILQSHWF